MAEEREVYLNHARCNELMNLDAGEGFALYDPQCDEPLTDRQIEMNMNALGPSTFLRQLCSMHNIDVVPAPQTEWECERAARKLIRTSLTKYYKGERYIQ
jgi:hypothetical protein